MNCISDIPLQLKIGPIPTEDSVGKEVITKMTANMATDKVFYTDSNGRDFLKRVSLTFRSSLSTFKLYKT